MVYSLLTRRTFVHIVFAFRLPTSVANPISGYRTHLGASNGRPVIILAVSSWTCSRFPTSDVEHPSQPSDGYSSSINATYICFSMCRFIT